jgi:hypothetical protein
MTSISNVPSVEDIRNSFPQPTVPTITGEPTYSDITRIHTILKSNAASISSNLGGGTHGLLGLMLPNDTYNTVTGHNFVRPPNPGPHAIIPPNATQAQIGAITRQFSQEFRAFQTMDRTDTALKQQILSAFDDDYTEELNHLHTGYTGVTAFELIRHLYDCYGLLDAVDLATNNDRMKEKWIATTPITKLYKQIESAMDVAEIGNAPFTAEQVINTAYLLVFATGQYDDACKEWNRKPTANKTWATFKTHFNKAYKEHRSLQRLQKSNGTGVHFGANMVEEVPPAVDPLESYQRETTEAIHALANATQSDHQAVANLTAANASLTTQLAQMQELMKNMNATLHSFQNQNNNHNRNNGFDPNSKHYCWTHGLTCKQSHTSRNCKHKAEGHQDTATYANRQGGSNHKCN